LGIKRSILAGWLRGADPPQKRILARVAGFLRRVGYLPANQGDYGTWKQKREQLKEALAARKREEAEFVRQLHDLERQRRDLDDLGNSLTRKLEYMISQIHHVLDALEDAQRQLVAQERQPRQFKQPATPALRIDRPTK